MKGEIAATTALVLLLLTLGSEAKVCQWVAPWPDVVCQKSLCLPYCTKEGYTDGYCTQSDRKCACTKECTGEGSSGDDRPTLGEGGSTSSKLQSMEQMNGAEPEVKQRVPCFPDECARSCRRQGYRNGFCRGGGVIPEYCVCVNHANFMGTKESNGGDVGDGGGQALFLEDEARVHDSVDG